MSHWDTGKSLLFPALLHGRADGLGPPEKAIAKVPESPLGSTPSISEDCPVLLINAGLRLLLPKSPQDPAPSVSALLPCFCCSAGSGEPCSEP